MADTDVTTPETATPEAPKNNATTAAPTQGNAADPAEVERLRKEAEQARMEANMLRNKLKAEEDAKAAQQAKELEEQNQFKTLYEQEKARREQIEAERATAERAATLKAEADKLFAQYPEPVRALAEEAGMHLDDTDESAIAAFKAKLDKVNSLVKQPKMTANNPGSSQSAGATQMDANEMHAMLNDPKKFEEYLKKNTTGIAGMMKQVAE